MTAHKHAALMLQYAQDARETETPWEMWKRKEKSDDSLWCDLVTHPMWSEDFDYRRKQRTMTIAGIEVPMPVEKLEIGKRYYLVDLSRGNLIYGFDFTEGSADAFDDDLLNGLIHEDAKVCKAHAEALIKATKDAMEAAR